MIKGIAMALFVLCSVCMQSAQAQAATIRFDSGSQSVGMGDPVSVHLRAIDSGGTINVFKLVFHDGQDLKRFQPVDFVPDAFQFHTPNIGPGPLGIAVLSLAGETVLSLDTDLQFVPVTVTSPATIPRCRRLSGYSVQV